MAPKTTYSNMSKMHAAYSTYSGISFGRLLPQEETSEVVICPHLQLSARDI